MTKLFKTTSLFAALAVFSMPALAAEKRAERTLDPGQTALFAISSDKPMLVSFEHLGSSEKALKCDGKTNREVSDPLPHCTGIFASDGKKLIDGTHVTGLHGAGVIFQPVDGKIRVGMKNLSKLTLDLAITAEVKDF